MELLWPSPASRRAWNRNANVHPAANRSRGGRWRSNAPFGVMNGSSGRVGQRRLLRRLPLVAVQHRFDGQPQPVLVGDGQVAPDELHGLPFERVHDGLNLAI